VGIAQITAIVLASTISAAAVPPPEAAGGGAPPSGRSKGINAPLSQEDRKALDANRGFRIPKPTEDLAWVGTAPMTQESFRGRVTVIQTFGGKQNLRTTLERTKGSLPPGVMLLGLHTPEQAANAPKAGDPSLPCPIAVDPSGQWCDALGVWTMPVNIVIDKSGAIAYAGLSQDGLREILPKLLEQEASNADAPPERPAPQPTEPDASGPARNSGPPTADPAVEWPAPEAGHDSGSVGRKMPDFQVEKWITAVPDRGNRLIAMDFWATWCGPCRASVPHLNDIHRKHGRDVLVVGITGESEQQFNDGMKRYKLKLSGFRYSLAIDTQGTLSSFFKIRGIPHLVIASADGIVRWRGHPIQLKPAMMERLVAANRAAFPRDTGAGPGKRPRGWASRAPDQKSR
jgi:cytochrome c biogenesis protein CcmG/thiol:disulfide interchange protein DsbE